MINEHYARQFCRDDISKIENYEEAMNDKTQTWHCHHRLELTLDGEFALSREQLKMHDMYYNRPYYELIFLTQSEHRRIHSKVQPRTEEYRRKISEANTGKKASEDTRKKLSESHKGQVPWNKGKHHSEYTLKKMSDSKKGSNNSMYGKHHSEDTRRKISEAAKRRYSAANK